MDDLSNTVRDWVPKGLLPGILRSIGGGMVRLVELFMSLLMVQSGYTLWPRRGPDC